MKMVKVGATLRETDINQRNKTRQDRKVVRSLEIAGHPPFIV